MSDVMEMMTTALRTEVPNVDVGLLAAAIEMGHVQAYSQINQHLEGQGIKLDKAWTDMMVVYLEGTCLTYALALSKMTPEERQTFITFHEARRTSLFAGLERAMELAGNNDPNLKAQFTKIAEENGDAEASIIKVVLDGADEAKATLMEGIAQGEKLRASKKQKLN